MNIQSFRRKIGLLVGAALLALAFLAAFSLTQERNLIVSARRNMLVTAVQTAQSVVRDYQARAANGSMSVEDAQKAARETLRTARYGGADGKTEYFYIWSTEGAAVMHPFKPEWEGKVMAGKLKDGDGIDIVTQLMDAMRASHDGTAFVMTRFPRPGQTEPLPKLQYVKKVDGWDWMVGSGLYTDDLDTQVRDTLIKDLALGGVMLFLLGAIGTVVLRSVLRQIGGEPSQAMAVISEVATGNLDTEVPQAHAGSMIDQLGHMVESLRTLVTNVRSATENIATASSEIAQGNTDLSHRTEQTASYLQTTASSMEQLTSTVQQTSASAQTANQPEDFRHHRRHRRHRLPDQYPGAQRCCRGRACRRPGAWLCRRRGRGAQSGATQRRRRQGDQEPDQRFGGKGRVGHGAGGQRRAHHD